MVNNDLLQEKLQEISAILGGSADTQPPSDCPDKLAWWLDVITMQLAAGGGNGSGGGGTVLHNMLTNRNIADQHTIAAITGLSEALSKIVTSHDQLNNRNVVDQHTIAAITGLESQLTNLLNVINSKVSATDLTNHANDTGIHTSLQEKASWGNKYSKPSTGIPKEDLSQIVQEKLDKAGTALQSFSENDPTVPGWAKQPQKPEYTAEEIGAIPVEKKGVANGVASLGADGKIPELQLPQLQLPASPQPGIEEAPADGKKYGRKDGEWVELEDSEGGGYVPPSEGIPKAYLSPEVQALLDKADSALQEESDPVYSQEKNSFALKTDLQGLVTVDTKQSIAGVKTFEKDTLRVVNISGNELNVSDTLDYLVGVAPVYLEIPQGTFYTITGQFVPYSLIEIVGECTLEIATSSIGSSMFSVSGNYFKFLVDKHVDGSNVFYWICGFDGGNLVGGSSDAAYWIRVQPTGGSLRKPVLMIAHSGRSSTSS